MLALTALVLQNPPLFPPPLPLPRNARVHPMSIGTGTLFMLRGALEELKRLGFWLLNALFGLPWKFFWKFANAPPRNPRGWNCGRGM